MIHRILLLIYLLILPIGAFANPLIQTEAKQAIVMDYETGAVLFEKNADAHMPTSSMSKVMTMYVVFEALKKGQLSEDQELSVSERAWRMQGSKMFIEVGKTVKVTDLIRGVVIQSGNDAAVCLAEGIAGSEEAFAEILNKKAKELGMNNSNFMDASGWPHENHYSTTRDLAILTRALIRDFPEYYPMFKEIDFTYHGIKQGNRNPLLYKNIGADGVKTGHTEAAGYGLIGSGIHNNRRVIIVINGLESDKARATESANLLEWGMKNFVNRKFFRSGDVIDNAAVIIGQKDLVPLVVQHDLTVTLPKIAADNFKAAVHYKEPLEAPVKKGQEIGRLEIEIPNEPKMSAPLYAGEDVKRLGFFSGTMTKFGYMLTHR